MYTPKTLLFAAAIALVATAPLAQAAKDPWIGQAFQTVLGRQPTGNEITGEWNVQNYGHGHWSSLNDLTNKVRARMTHQGVAYIFIKPQQALYQGHIGWGFMMDDGRYCYGSTENPLKSGPVAQAIWEAVNINPGQDNGFWMGYADTEADMLSAMKTASNYKTATAQYPYGNRCSAYWHYKSTIVATRNASYGLNQALWCKKSGFKGITWNCLDQTYFVLEGYGVDKNAVMPWKQTHPSPNYWFNDFGYLDPRTLNAVKGNNTSGYPL